MSKSVLAGLRCRGNPTFDTQRHAPPRDKSNAFKWVFTCFLFFGGGGDRKSSILGRFPAQPCPGGLGKDPGRGLARFAQIFSPGDQFLGHSVRFVEPSCDCIGATHDEGAGWTNGKGMTAVVDSEVYRFAVDLKISRHQITDDAFRCTL